ncbi:MAG TPA: FeoC-like transcriptional regulator [Anaerolineales bacterium]
MLEQLLTEIRRGGPLEVNALAARLNTSPRLVAAMLEHLERSGLLSAYLGCAEGCRGCSLETACPGAHSGGARLWQG